MALIDLTPPVFRRRDLLRACPLGLASVAVRWLLGGDTLGAEEGRFGRNRESGGTGQGDLSSLVRPPLHRPRARNVIFLHMVGAPSQLDLFDEKPTLRKLHGQMLPDDLWQGLQLAFIRKQPRLFGSPFEFRSHGRSGLRLSELLPNLGSVADELLLIKSMQTEQINHAPAQLMMQTGFGRFGRPCLGSWVSYGLGTENQELPAFVVMNTGLVAGAGNSLWGSGFLPTVHQGVEFRSEGDPVLFLSDPPGVDRLRRQRVVRHVNRLNAYHLHETGDREIETRIKQYELAFRMQSSVPELMNVSSEPASVHARYGTEPGKPSFANHCLLARRLVERGVRFVQLYDQGWDAHSGLRGNLTRKCRQIDRPIAALIADLKQRGLLDETLVVFASEFGRTPMLQGKDGQAAGRDHHRRAFTAWMCGAGIQGGRSMGATDPLGFDVVKDPVPIHDLHATILELLGLDHRQLTYRYQGRDFRLTDVAGHPLPV